MLQVSPISRPSFSSSSRSRSLTSDPSTFPSQQALLFSLLPPTDSQPTTSLLDGFLSPKRPMPTSRESLSSQRLLAPFAFTNSPLRSSLFAELNSQPPQTAGSHPSSILSLGESKDRNLPRDNPSFVHLSSFSRLDAFVSLTFPLSLAISLTGPPHGSWSTCLETRWSLQRDRCYRSSRGSRIWKLNHFGFIVRRRLSFSPPSRRLSRLPSSLGERANSLRQDQI